MEWSIFHQTPLTWFAISTNGRAITQVHTASEKDAGTLRPAGGETPEAAKALLAETARQLDEYCAGRLFSFDLPLEPRGTGFQKKVWLALREIPYGETRTYKDIALMAGCPKGFRAVGLANNRNPIAVIVPCHRVIGSDGKLTGYAGGLDLKAALLKLERRGE